MNYLLLLLPLIASCGRDDINCYTRGEQCDRDTLHHTETVTERVVEVEPTVAERGPTGPAGDPGTDGANGTSCSVIQTDTGAIISCEDGTSADIYHGDDGEHGTPCSVVQTESGATIECLDSSATVSNGPQGVPGTSCSVVQVDSGAVIFCEDGSSADIQHGEDGEDFYWPWEKKGKNK